MSAGQGRGEGVEVGHALCPSVPRSLRPADSSRNFGRFHRCSSATVTSLFGNFGPGSVPESDLRRLVINQDILRHVGVHKLVLTILSFPFSDEEWEKVCD